MTVKLQGSTKQMQAIIEETKSEEDLSSEDEESAQCSSE